MSKKTHPPLQPAGRLEVISLVDNIVDLQSPVPEGVLRYWQWVSNTRRAAVPWAEHGFSVLVRVYGEDETAHVILFDTGAGPTTAVINTRRLLLGLDDVTAIVLSHGHMDHAGGLLGALQAIQRPNVPVLIHEQAFATRGWLQDDGTVQRDPAFPRPETIAQAGGQVQLVQKPLLVADGLALLTGEIPRRTDFEPGRPGQMILVNGEWQPAPEMLDDQALVVHVRDMGLVVITGCAHAGVINTVRYAQELVPDVPLYAIIGGFHLVGRDSEARIARTVDELARLAPARLVSSHCTGSPGTRALANALPEAFVPAGVGNLYRFPTQSPN
ncbi:MAG: MBL fold metallo-hydrolase [Chloroflexi bacterium]|nr:MBL fold metallo-hydrolase [Chloroflexota bacterium]MBU1751824.1 MBL fold metallo-hydrolase [Chloroflexota bacterium]MBU1877885.1 MBL fold metallo-hydrolase [Chloroflexota bacterium]